jgi:transposase
MSRDDLTSFEWRVIVSLLPDKPRGVPRVDDRRVLNRIFWVLRSGSPWRDLPERYGPYTTCYNHFRRWTQADVWDRMMDAVTDVRGGDVRTGQYPAKVEPKEADLLLAMALQTTQPDRALLQQTQILPTHRNTIRQARLGSSFPAIAKLACILRLRHYESTA